MKFTKLSLVAALAVSSAFAGGDITPVEPVVAAPVVEAATTISGKAVAYYYTAEDKSIAGRDLFENESNSLGTAVTLDVTHRLFDGITANFSAVGYANLLENNAAGEIGIMESGATGAFFNVANITATFGDTTLVAGRQLINSPMFGGFDWLLAPGAFEAYTLVNSSISNLTLVGTYVTKWRDNNDGRIVDGDEFHDLKGENFALGAVYANKDLFNASLWYYNIDAYSELGLAKYTQFYVDANKDFSGFNIAAQYVATDYSFGTDASAYGIKLGASLAGFDIYAAYNRLQDSATGYVGVDSLYTSSWNTFTSATYNTSDLDAYKIGASTTFGALSAEASYAAYGNDGQEIDVILGYAFNDAINLDVVYTNTAANVANSDDNNALEVYATYKF